jgi:hypothetical protein
MEKARFIVSGGTGAVYTLGANMVTSEGFITGYRCDDNGETTDRKVVCLDNIEWVK